MGVLYPLKERPVTWTLRGHVVEARQERRSRLWAFEVAEVAWPQMIEPGKLFRVTYPELGWAGKLFLCWVVNGVRVGLEVTQ